MEELGSFRLYSVLTLFIQIIKDNGCISTLKEGDVRMKKMFVLLSTLAAGTVLTVNAAPLTLEDINGFKATYLSEQTFNDVGATFSLVIATVAILVGLRLKSMGK